MDLPFGFKPQQRLPPTSLSEGVCVCVFHSEHECVPALSYTCYTNMCNHASYTPGECMFKSSCARVLVYWLKVGSANVTCML